MRLFCSGVEVLVAVVLSFLLERGDVLLLFLFCCCGGGGSVFVMVVEVEVCLKEQKITRQRQLFFHNISQCRCIEALHANGLSFGW